MAHKKSPRRVRLRPAAVHRASARWAAVALLGAPLVFPLDASAQAVDDDDVKSLAPVVVHGANGNTSLTVPTAREARQAIEQTPGGVEVVPDTAWTDTPAETIKSMLDYVPGVFAQPKWGTDTRLSIRGSGLSRYYHLRGINLYQDGMPLTSADGSSDFSWIDPTAYRYVEVFKGANALRFGAATLGGAINFVSPTGLDADRFQGRVDVGTFGQRRVQASTGFASGPLDGFITGSWQRQDGFREQSAGNAQHVEANLGWRFNKDAETRFYLSGVRQRQQIPGSVTRESALTRPRVPAAIDVVNNWQRNIDGGRIANRTTFKHGDTRYELGAWFMRNNLDHPIYQYLDNQSNDYGAYGRLVNSTPLAGHRNTATLGLNWQPGATDAKNYVNNVAREGALLSHTHDRANNTTLYGEDAFYITPDVALIAGAQYLRAERKRTDLFNGGGLANRNGDKTWNFFNPKVGALWQVNPQVQVYGNVSRSAEPPTFGDMQFSTANDLARLKPQRATTVEIGTRSTGKDLGWDISVYRARVKNELQCVSSIYNFCDQTTNLDTTIHQGLELGIHWTALRDLFTPANKTDSVVINAAYTYSNFHFSNDPTWGSNQLPGAPRHFLRAEALYKHSSGWFVGPNIEWVPQAYYADNANTLKTDSYALLGLRAGWEHGPYSFYLEGRNLTNRKYIASTGITDRANAGSTLFEPGAGRAIFAGMQIRF